jgi:hypothetical protein
MGDCFWEGNSTMLLVALMNGRNWCFTSSYTCYSYALTLVLHQHSIDGYKKLINGYLRCCTRLY